jgi:type II secretory pathway pseudopilin PulG
MLELLVTVALIMILTVMTTGYLTTSSREKAMASCQNNLQKIYLALNIYKSDNNAFPFIKDATTSAQPLSLLVPKCTTMTEIFICPLSKDEALPEAESFAKRRISYSYYMGLSTNTDSAAIIASDAQVDNAPKKRGQPVFSSDGSKPGNNHGDKGGNLITCAGEMVVSGPKASRDFSFPPEVRLLNP